jgi:hypothetical protein
VTKGRLINGIPVKRNRNSEIGLKDITDDETVVGVLPSGLKI